MQDGIQTNNYLESYNRTLNSLARKDSNVWIVQDLLIKQDADARRTQQVKIIPTTLTGDINLLTTEQELSLS